MKRPNNAITCLLVIASVFSVKYVSAQDNVGIGTLTPNEKSILELQSTTKGFLMPRMERLQRLALFPLDSTHAGLMVYDLEDSLFYYWNSVQWIPIPNPNGLDNDWIVVGNDMYSGVAGNIGIGTVLPAAKLHVVGTPILEGLQPYNANTVLVLNGGDSVGTRMIPGDIWDGDDVIDNDADPANELQTLTLTGQTLSISNGNSVTIPDNVNDADPDPTNELQDLSVSVSGTNRTISISGGTPVTFDVNDNDSDPNNEIQTLTITQSNDTINWVLSNNGGSGNFSFNDGDWTRAGVGRMYPTNNQDSIGIGTTQPQHRFDVNGNARIEDRLYFRTTDFYISNNSNELYHSSNGDMRFVTTGGHVVRYYDNSGESVVNYALNGTDILTMRGANAGSFTNNVGINTTTPLDKLHVNGNVRVGLVNPPGFSNNGRFYGDLIYFSGGPGYTAPGGPNIDSDNTDLLFMGRYNNGPDQSELRIGIGDNYVSPNTQIDRLSIGAFPAATGIDDFQGIFDFEINNPSGSFNPMLSITAWNTTPDKQYHGGVSITKPAASSGQFINLIRSGQVAWSIGTRYGTDDFAIGLASTNDASWNNPYLMVQSTTGYLGIGTTSPNYRVDLPNQSSPAGQGRANAWVTYSDGRFKKNRKTLESVLGKVEQLLPLTYKWEGFEYDAKGAISGTGEVDDDREYGFIAQDVYKVFPEMVNKPEDENKDTWTIDYPRLTVVLTKAVQELQAALSAEQKSHSNTVNELREMKTLLQKLDARIGELENESSELSGKR